MTDGAARLLPALEALEAGQELAPELREWLATGLRAHLAGAPLEQALGLQSTGRGKRTGATKAAQEARDRLLRAAAQLEPRARVSEAARKLMDAARRLERAHQRKAQGRLTEVERLVADAIAFAPMPKKRRLLDILVCSEIPITLHSTPVEMQASNETGARCDGV